MQPQQIHHPFIMWRNPLRQSSHNRPTRKHFHQMIMRRIQSQRQTLLQPHHLFARIIIISTFCVCGIDACGAGGAGKSVGYCEVEGC